MKIYFYDGDLNFAPPIERVFSDNVFFINASQGPTINKEDLDFYQKNIADNKCILTNSLLALSTTYGWNWAEDHIDIYLWVEKKHKYMRLDELTEREIRFAHNIEKMFLAGTFNI